MWAVVPMPVEPRMSSPGCALAQASMSLKLFQGLLAGTSTPKVVPDTCTMGLRSATGSGLSHQNIVVLI
jgi:hypothetical protein